MLTARSLWVVGLRVVPLIFLYPSCVLEGHSEGMAGMKLLSVSTLRNGVQEAGWGQVFQALLELYSLLFFFFFLFFKSLR